MIEQKANFIYQPKVLKLEELDSSSFILDEKTALIT